jgi:hypothetical protein
LYRVIEKNSQEKNAHQVRQPDDASGASQRRARIIDIVAIGGMDMAA